MRITSLKATAAWFACLIIRLIPIRPANVEPILATAMPAAPRLGIPGAFLFGFLSILAKDLLDGRVGIWTAGTAIMYGLVTLGARVFANPRYRTAVGYAMYAVIATLVYDAVTGVVMGPLFFHQTLLMAFLGQIPFTLRHLFSNVLLAIVVTPILERWMSKEPAPLCLPQTAAK